MWWSKDGKEWEGVKDGMWQDKDGKWLKIWRSETLVVGRWQRVVEVPEWKWQGTEGKWYKSYQSWNPG